MPTLATLPSLTPDQQTRAEAWRAFFMAQEEALEDPMPEFRAFEAAREAVADEYDAFVQEHGDEAKNILYLEEDLAAAHPLAARAKALVEREVMLRASLNQMMEKNEKWMDERGNRFWFVPWPDDLSGLLEAAAGLRPTASDTFPLLAVAQDHADDANVGYPALAWRTLLALPEMETPERVIPDLLSLAWKKTHIDPDDDLFQHDFLAIAKVATRRHWPLLESWMERQADWSDGRGMPSALEGMGEAAKSDPSVAATVAAYAAKRLARHADNHPQNNAFLIGVLLALDAEHRHVSIAKAAYAADHVNEHMNGDWKEVAKAWGLPASEHDTLPRRPHWWPFQSHVWPPECGAARDIAPHMRREYEKKRNLVRAEKAMQGQGVGHPVYKKRK